MRNFTSTVKLLLGWSREGLCTVPSSQVGAELLESSSANESNMPLIQRKVCQCWAYTYMSNLIISHCTLRTNELTDFSFYEFF